MAYWVLPRMDEYSSSEEGLEKEDLLVSRTGCQELRDGGHRRRAASGEISFPTELPKGYVQQKAPIP